jgi:hypothetical protein
LPQRCLSPAGLRFEPGPGFALRGSTLELRSNERFVCDFALRAYAPLRCRPSASFHHVAQIVVDRRGFRAFVDRDEIDVPVTGEIRDPRFAAAFYGTRAIFNRLLAGDGEVLAFYGAALALGPAAVAIIGPSTIGKTMLVLHTIALGARLYGDETVFVERTGAITGALRRRLMIREPGLALLPNDRMRKTCLADPNVYAMPQGRLWYAIDPEQMCGDGVYADPAPLAAIVCIDGERGARSILETIPTALAVREIAKRRHNAYDLAGIASMHAILRGVAAFRLRLGPPAEAGRLLCGILG